MSNIDMMHEWIAFKEIAKHFPHDDVTMDTLLDSLPDGKAMVPTLHAALDRTFDQGMPELEQLEEAETVGQIVNAVVDSVAAKRRLNRALHLSGKHPSLGFWGRVRSMFALQEP